MEKGKPTPKVTKEPKPKPEFQPKIVELPIVGKPENTIKIGDTLIEIKPTKLRYQRDKTATFYKALEIYPLMEILAWEEDVLGDGRDGDKCVMDWLIAATDNPELITEHYDSIDTETVETILAIFKRVNKIDEKEEKRKNLEREKVQKA